MVWRTPWSYACTGKFKGEHSQLSDLEQLSTAMIKRERKSSQVFSIHV